MEHRPGAACPCCPLTCHSASGLGHGCGQLAPAGCNWSAAELAGPLLHRVTSGREDHVAFHARLLPATSTRCSTATEAPWLALHDTCPPSHSSRVVCWLSSSSLVEGWHGWTAAVEGWWSHRRCSAPPLWRRPILRAWRAAPAVFRHYSASKSCGRGSYHGPHVLRKTWCGRASLRGEAAAK